MFFEILLLSVVVVTAYLGPMMIRRLPPGRRLYGWMLVADLGLALVSFAARQDGGGDDTADLLGVIAIGGAVCLVLVPPMLRDLGRRALTHDRMRLALWLTDLRELLQPGLGARAEREVIEAIVAVRSGRVEEAVETLRETRSALENPMARRQIDERIVLTYLYARDWERAIAHFETHLDNPPGPMSPQLVVEMVRAYCEAGELARAAGLVEILERSPMAGEPILALLVARSRLVFLAFVGRTTAVDAIVAATGPLGAMPPAARQFWSGIARLNAGDRSGARSSLEKAARLSGRDKRARELAETTLSSLDQPGVVGPHVVPPPVAELADRLTAAATRTEGAAQPAAPPRLAGVGARAVPVTMALVAANVLVSVIIGVLFGSTGDIGALVLAGANLKPAVATGEWWRLPASMFLHVGLLHLVLNMYGLWILGKLVEQMVGSVRYFAIYMASGLCGAVASFALGPPGVSAGASGAVFGVLGAAVAELALRRKEYPGRWRGALLRNLLFLTAANVAIGFYYEAIDQSAHLGGLVAGAVLAAVLSRRGRLGESNLVKGAALALAILGAGSIAYAGFGVATTSYAETVAGYPWRTVEERGMRWQQPEPWAEVEFGGFALGQGDPAAKLDSFAYMQSQVARRDGDAVDLARSKAWVLPAGWQTLEMIVVADSMAGDQRLRSVYMVKEQPGGLVWEGFIRVPEALVEGAGPVILRVLGSVEQVADEPLPAEDPGLLEGEVTP